jgi:hypothetical protein
MQKISPQHSPKLPGQVVPVEITELVTILQERHKVGNGLKWIKPAYTFKN